MINQFYKKWNTIGWIKTILLAIFFIVNIIFPLPNVSSQSALTPIVALIFGVFVIPFLIKFNYKFIGKPIFGEKLEIPNWNSNPLEVKKPLLFFHFMAYFFIVIGLSLVISSLIHFFKLNVFGFDSIFLGIGTILGIRLLLKWERK